MAKVFPRVGNDSFPHLDTAKPFKRKVPFDYERYDYTATIKLCHVSWPADYRHVVKWASAAARDAWFDDLDGDAIELSNGFTRTQTDRVMVDVPYDVALTYNYAYMRVPPLTQDERIIHEGETGIRTICAFIAGCIYHSPSTTELVLQVDYWSTYLPYLQVSALMLDRGHAPMYATDASAYLANPRAHCANLLTPDINYGAPDVVASATIANIANGDKMLVMASTIPYSQIESLTLAEIGLATSAPTYEDYSSRAGHQVIVNDYDWAYDGHSYANMRRPSAYAADDALPVYTYLYAMSSERAAANLATLASRVPQFIESVQAAYILPRSAITLSDTYTIAGVSMRRIVPQTGYDVVTQLALNKGAFAYPARYADIAKLYTYPYARLMVSDGMGQEIEVRIENTGADLALVQQVCPLMDALRWDVLVRDANAAGANAYTWEDLNGNALAQSLPATDIARYTLNLGIPTYALMLDARTVHNVRQYYDAQAQRASAIIAYQATMRSANNALENALDSNATAKTNADASADTAHTNAYNNADNTREQAKITNKQRDDSRTKVNTYKGGLGSGLIGDALQNIYDSSNADLEYTEFATDTNLKSEAVSGIQNIIANAAVGNVVGMVNAGVSGIVNITTSNALSTLSLQNQLDHQSISQSHTRYQMEQQKSLETELDGIRDTGSTDAADQNADTAEANADNTRTVTKANATRTKNTGDANARASRSVAETNAKAALRLAQSNYTRAAHAADMDAPVAFGSTSGDASSDALMRRIVQVRVETQNASAIARAGDAFLRYGYMYDGLWRVTDWCPDEHDYCYWQAHDIWINAANLDNAEVARELDGMLNAGITVWNDPAKIGASI